MSEFRAFDALNNFADIADAQLEAELQHAEEFLFGFVANRGYDFEAIVGANVSARRAIMKVARIELLAIKGVNPADPGHALLILERDRAVEWFQKWIASGAANLVGPGAPGRARTMTAKVISDTSDDGSSTRGW